MIVTLLWGCGVGRYRGVGGYIWVCSYGSVKGGGYMWAGKEKVSIVD